MILHVTREEAEARARELNRELGAAGEQRSYYVEVETATGIWEVEERAEPEERPGWLRRLWDGLVSSGGGP